MDSVHELEWTYFADGYSRKCSKDHVKYEMFLDRRGKKISKCAVGNVITSQRWLKYGTKQSLSATFVQADYWST